MPYLYHRRSHDMVGDTIYPLNDLKTINPKIYAKEFSKYEGRLHIPQQRIALLGNCLWNDVIFMSPVHPQDLFDAREAAGFTTKPTSVIYQIDPTTLDKSNLAVYLFRPDRTYEDNFAPYDEADLTKYSEIPKATKDYFAEVYASGADFIPLLWRYIPHILYKGSIDVSNTAIISIS